MENQVDYSLYLVTDSTEAILGSRDLVEVVEQALQGGVTIVQYRDKTSDTRTLISTAKTLHTACRQHNIPLLINDRVDIALAIGCEGVHLGQDDMSIQSARQILGPGKIVGATVTSASEARIAVENGADYLGIGTVYATSTKKDTKEIIGINGVRDILQYLDRGSEAEKGVKTVCIGGVNASNLQRILYQTHAPSASSLSPKSLDGVAIVSAIIGASNPQSASSHLAKLIHSPPPFTVASREITVWLNNDDEIRHVLHFATLATQKVHSTTPLSHNITNLVVQNFAANIALCIGASPIMSSYGPEAADLANLHGGLVINSGTVTPDMLQNYKQAVAAYNAVGGPVVLDPVGAGATSVRRGALGEILNAGYFDVVKGNESEILAVARASGIGLKGMEAEQQRGVDSGPSTSSREKLVALVKTLALRERNIVLLTGATDIISDGTRTYTIANGHAYLGRITGSGCTLGTVLSAYLAANRGDKLLAAVAGVLHFEIAAECAAERADVKGPGTFVPAFLDELYARGVEVAGGRETWEGRARIGCVKHVGMLEKK